MTTTCPGCHQAATRYTPACLTCVERLPTSIRRTLDAHDQDRATIHQHVTTWLTDHPHVTPREIRVLHLIAEGHRDDDIATTLEISVNTVRDHIKRVTRKFGCSGRPHLMATLYKKGYLPAPCTDQDLTC